MKSTRNKINTVPETVVKKIFFNNVDYFRVEGEGEFKVNGNSPQKHIYEHLSGEKDIHVNPLSESGMSSWIVLDFIISEKQKHPFSNAFLIQNELKKRGIPSHIEVTDGGKGYYRLWIFFDFPVGGLEAANAFKRFASDITGLEVRMHPDKMSDDFVPLPFQGESILFQRRVFVNSVGKMIKNQSGYLLNLDYCPNEIASAFIDEFNILPDPDLPENVIEKPIVNDNSDIQHTDEKSEENNPAAKIPSDIKKKTDTNQLSFDIPLSVVSEENVHELENDLLFPTESFNYNSVTESNNREEKNTAETCYNIEQGFLIFKTGKDLSAIVSSAVKEIIEGAQITPYPSESETFGGVILHESDIIPVIQKNSGYKNSGKTKFIIIEKEYGKYGIGTTEIKGLYLGLITDKGQLKVSGNNDNTEIKEIEIMDCEELSTKYSFKKINGRDITSEKLIIFEYKRFFFGVEINFVREIISFPGRNLSTSNITYKGEIIPLIKPSENSNNHNEFSEKNSFIEKRVLILERDEILTGILADTVYGLNSGCAVSESEVPDCIAGNSFIKTVLRLTDSEKIIFTLNPEKISGYK